RAVATALCGMRAGSSGSSNGSMTVSAVKPCLMALHRDCCFPSSVFGPVLLSALRRFALSCLSDVMLGSSRPEWVPARSPETLEGPDVEPAAIRPLRAGGGLADSLDGTCARCCSDGIGTVELRRCAYARVQSPPADLTARQ